MKKETDKDPKPKRKRGRPVGSKAKKGTAGLGRPVGAVNKTTATVKQAIAEALCEGKGAAAFFVQLKKDDPRTFANIAVKLIPVQHEIDANVDTHITFELVKE